MNKMNSINSMNSWNEVHNEHPLSRWNVAHLAFYPEQGSCVGSRVCRQIISHITRRIEFLKNLIIIDLSVLYVTDCWLLLTGRYHKGSTTASVCSLVSSWDNVRGGAGGFFCCCDIADDLTVIFEINHKRKMWPIIIWCCCETNLGDLGLKLF